MKVEVFNVGQGDSFLLLPDDSCMFSQTPILVDVGPQSAKVADKLSRNNYHLILTHSHKDHIGGFPKVFREKNIESITIPYYLPEIINIAKFIKKKVPQKYGSLDWRKIKRIQKVRLVGEGDKLCNHITILNPPKSPYQYFEKVLRGDDSGNIQEALNILNEYGFELPTEDILNYNSPLIASQLDDNEYFYQAKMFVHYFFISLSMRVSDNSLESANYYADAHLELTANQASIVFKYVNPNGDWLFTGDADQSVFHRIINTCNHSHVPFNKCSCNALSAKYLKVPHHGSRGNISDYILGYIDPNVAFISHKNRKFGRSNDPHPHHEVIDLLDVYKVKTYYTNAVVKNRKTIKPGTFGVVENGALEFR
ncbi:ComEC/Rec2 family competence protein [Psychromonas sp. KJ10-10]|uniref:ComEC/Rec2 family competence protein n=1 Tax=Psychromonas sp. KJ10-10 TaxID=3391823 RepID=UPI0039B36F6F